MIHVVWSKDRFSCIVISGYDDMPLIKDVTVGRGWVVGLSFSFVSNSIILTNSSFLDSATKGHQLTTWQWWFYFVTPLMNDAIMVEWHGLANVCYFFLSFPFFQINYCFASFRYIYNYYMPSMNNDRWGWWWDDMDQMPCMGQIYTQTSTNASHSFYFSYPSFFLFE